MNLAIFASGRGSNARAIVEATFAGVLSARVRLILSNNSGAGALEVAHEFNVPDVHLSRRLFVSDEEYENALLNVLRDHDVDFIALAGYMKKVPSRVVKEFRNRIVNVHPALLPNFGGEGMYGLNVHEAVLRSGAQESGATIHIVDEEYDRGPIVLQRSIPVYPDDTPGMLAARVLEVEHRIYVEALQAFAEGRVAIQHGIVTIH